MDQALQVPLVTIPMVTFHPMATSLVDPVMVWPAVHSIGPAPTTAFAI